jgi:hypothetical protein
MICLCLLLNVNNFIFYLGYEIVYKHCGCLCGHGYLRKDLDWVPPTPYRYRYLCRCQLFIQCFRCGFANRIYLYSVLDPFGFFISSFFKVSKNTFARKQLFLTVGNMYLSVIVQE